MHGGNVTADAGQMILEAARQMIRRTCVWLL
jgi:hypothetical protein